MFYQNAKITETKLGCLHDRNIMTFWIMLDYGGSGQGFGGYCLDSYCKEKKEREPSVLTGYLVHGVLNTLELDSWENLKGTYVRAILDSDKCNAKVIGLGHIIKNKEFIFKDFPNRVKLAL